MVEHVFNIFITKKMSSQKISATEKLKFAVRGETAVTRCIGE